MVHSVHGVEIYAKFAMYMRCTKMSCENVWPLHKELENMSNS